jgi:bacterioferritin-associated ferredoxin
MYVCICNALKEAEARRVAAGCGVAREIYDQLGCVPRCGRCIPAMEEILDELRPGTAAPIVPRPASGPAPYKPAPFAGSPVDLHIVPAE